MYYNVIRIVCFKFMPALFLLFALCCGFLSDALFAQQQSDKTEMKPAVSSESSSQKEDTTSVTSDSTVVKNTVEMTDIHDIKPPEKIGYDLKWLYYLISGIIIALLLAGIFFFFKYRKRKIQEKQIITLSSDELALKLLDELLDVDNIDGKIFYFNLSAILRNYIQGRYKINAPEMTTEELIPKIDSFGLDRELSQKLRALLHSADPVKFAGVTTVQAKMQNDLLFVIDFVKKTREVR